MRTKIKKHLTMICCGFFLSLLINAPTLNLGASPWIIQKTPEIASSAGYTYFYDSFVLTSPSPSRTFQLNTSIDYLGILHVGVAHTEPRAVKNRAFEFSWTNTPDIPLLASRSEVNLDTSWLYFFANLSETSSDPMEFTVFLKEGVTKLSLKWMFHFNYHKTVELSPQNTRYETGSAKRTLNTTMMTFLGVLPESSSNISFQIKGGYKDENKTYLIAPNHWFIHNITIRARDENETEPFPHTVIYIKLENLSSKAKFTILHFKIAWDPNVDQNLDTAGIEELLAIIVVLGTLSLLVVLTGNMRKYEK